MSKKGACLMINICSHQEVKGRQECCRLIDLHIFVSHEVNFVDSLSYLLYVFLPKITIANNYCRF